MSKIAHQIEPNRRNNRIYYFYGQNTEFFAGILGIFVRIYITKYLQWQ